MKLKKNSRRVLLFSLLAVLLIFDVTLSNAQILSYTSDSSGTLNLVAANATGTSLARVNGASRPGTPCSSGYSAASFTTAASYLSTLPAVEVSVTPNTGYSLNVTGFDVDLRRSTTGPADTRFAYSTDGGATWTDQGSNQAPNNASCGTTTTGAWTTTILVAAPNQLKFRVYGFNASGTTGTLLALNLLINGAVTSTSGCGIPSGLIITSITATSAILNWIAVSGATSYNIQYRQVGTSTWSTTTSGTNSVAVSVLTPATNYEFQVQTICGGSTTSAFSGSGTFTTSSLSCTTPTGLMATAITASSATLSWGTAAGAVSYNIQYRQTGTSTWSTTTSATTSVAITGLVPGTAYEFQVQTVCSASATSTFSGSGAFTTTGSTSGSTGKMAIYFNNPVNTSVSTGVDAIYLNSAFADTIVAYINRAKYTIDIAQYDYNQSSGFANIATAINNAYASGKKIRWIYDGSQPNTGIALLNAGIRTLASPTGGAYGIMHDKFVIIDSKSTNPGDAIVCTGSEDWGVTQFNANNNNLLFIQDSSLAHAYTNEFNMMWGDTGIAPNASLSKFGPYKTDLGAHIFHIGGKLVELYFSPSDGTDTHIQSSINSANTDLYFGVYDFTESTDANDIVARHTAGVYTAGIVDQYSNTGSAYPILTSGLGASMKTFTSSSLIYHHKMVIVDPSNACSDPQVLTGSHNWTTSANTKNDENTLIIHNDTIANIYYQAFYAEYASLGGTLTAISPCTAVTCGTPTGLSATMMTATSALLNWTLVTGAMSYTIQYRQTGTTTWSTTSSSITSVTISGLTPATTYEFEVETSCSAGSSTFSASTEFTTLAPPCSVPTGLSTIDITATSASLTWVVVSGAVSYNIQYRAIGTTTWSTATSLVNSVVITGLIAGTTYEFQVEVVCSSGTSAYSSSSNFTTLTITCPLPAGLSATSITTTSALLNWTAAAGAASYSIQYRPAGTTSWIYTSTSSTSATVSGLTPATIYEFQVQTICSPADSSGYTLSALFTTLGAPCEAPTGLTVMSLTATSAGLTWIAVPGAAGYNIQYRQTGTTAWTLTSSAINSATIIGLLPATSYQYEIQSRCSSVTDTSVYSLGSTFTTQNTTGLASKSLAENSLNVYPNPATQNVTISYNLETSEKVSISICDVVGQEIMSIAKNDQQAEGIHIYNATINIPGIYFIKLTAGYTSVTRKIVKL